MSAVASAYTTYYFDEVKKIAEMLGPGKIDRIIQLLRSVRETPDTPSMPPRTDHQRGGGA